MVFFRANSCFNYSFNIICRLYKHQIRTVSTKRKPVLYGDEASPPVRFAMMTAAILKIDLDFHKIDLFKSENVSEFYKKINPLQKVPVLAVKDNVICDSHAIAIYFCRSSNDKELYPKDTLLRAKIDELLYFNSGVLFPIDSAVFTEFFSGKWPADEIKINKWYSSLDYLDFKLSKDKWLTGNKMRLCDICCATTVSSLEILVPLLRRHENLKKWLNKLKLLPCFKINTHGLQRLQSFVDMTKQQS